MSKNVYDLINKTKTNLEEYETLELNELEEVRMKQYVQKKIMKKSNKMRKSTVAVAAAALVVVGTFSGVASASLTNPTAHKIANFIGINASLDEYGTIVGTSVSKDDVTLTLNEVVLDGNELWVSVTSTSSVYDSTQLTHPSGIVYINGAEINMGATGELVVLDDNTVQTVLKFPLDQKYSGEVDIKVDLSTPLSGDVKSSQPHYVFKFKGQGTDLKNIAK